MIAFSLFEIALMLNAKHVGMNIMIDTISINSNCITKKCMFIALIGKRFDGHNFAEQAVIAGARALLVNRYLLIQVPQVIVMDTHVALLKIAHWVRSRVSSKIISITGSTGKTSVKEMTVAILKRSGRVIATRKNLNNLIGVPITLLNLTDQTDFGVIELGTSKFGELNRLSKIVTADVALINNIFPAHISGLGSLTAIKKEKGEIFSGLSNYGQAIINADSHAFSIWSRMLQNKVVWRFSVYSKEGVDFFVNNIHYYKNGTQFVLNGPYGVALVSLYMLGKHNISNALAASALSFSVGARLSEIVSGLKNIKPIPGRLFPIILNEGKLLLLDDTYNSNIGSMIAAIDVLNSMPGYRILVTSDMLELGEYKTIKYHCFIGKLVSKTKIDQILTIGDISYVIFTRYGKCGKHFHNKIDLIHYLNNVLFRNQYVSVLIKGSRKFHMEEVINAIKDQSKCYFG